MKQLTVGIRLMALIKGIPKSLSLSNPRYSSKQVTSG
jgi:hypothetical protein